MITIAMVPKRKDKTGLIMPEKCSKLFFIIYFMLLTLFATVRAHAQDESSPSETSNLFNKKFIIKKFISNLL